MAEETSRIKCALPEDAFNELKKSVIVYVLLLYI